MFFSSWLRNWMTNPHTSRTTARRRPARFRPGLEILEGRDVPSTLTVTTTLDEVNPNDGVLSLREAIRQANPATPGGDTIVFDGSLSGQTITLNGSELLIDKNLNIQGPGANLLAISGNHLSRVFKVAGTVTMAGLTIRDGNAGTSYSYYESSNGGGILNGGALSLSGCNFSGNSAYGDGLYGGGGAISNNSTLSYGTLSLNGCTFSGNSTAFGDGGCIVSVTSLTVSNCVFSGNSAHRNGGAIYHVNTPLSLSGCTFLGNTAWNGNGGAIFDGGGGVGALNLSLSGCTLSGNSAHYHNQPILNQTGCGGAIYTGAATTMLTACTLSGNSAVSGGAIFTTQDKGNSLTLSGCTITSNTATSQGGGIYIYAGDAFLQSTTITNNSAGLQGGGIFNDVNGRLTLYSSSVVSGNLAPDGADIYNLGHVFRKKG